VQWPGAMLSTLKMSLSAATAFAMDVIRRDDEVESASDQVDFGIDGRRRLDDLVDPRVRAADHKHEAVRV